MNSADAGLPGSGHNASAPVPVRGVFGPSVLKTIRPARKAGPDDLSRHGATQYSPTGAPRVLPRPSRTRRRTKLGQHQISDRAPPGTRPTHGAGCSVIPSPLVSGGRYAHVRPACDGNAVHGQVGKAAMPRKCSRRQKAATAGRRRDAERDHLPQATAILKTPALTQLRRGASGKTTKQSATRPSRGRMSRRRR